jgi:hypothetical protein
MKILHAKSARSIGGSIGIKRIAFKPILVLGSVREPRATYQSHRTRTCSRLRSTVLPPQTRVYATKFDSALALISPDPQPF